MATFDALLKEYYTPDVVESLLFPDRPFYGALQKKVDQAMAGDVVPVPIFVNAPQGQGGVFATAQANATPSKSFKWQITPGDYFGVVTISDKVIKASRSNNGAFLQDKQVEMDLKLDQIAESMHQFCWGNGGGSLGQIADITGNVLTLTQASDIVNFFLDMKVVASANSGAASTDSLKDSGDASTVTAVNPSTGQLTITVADISGLAVGDYLFRQSEFAGDTTVQILRGVQAFIPATDTLPDLWGVTQATRQTLPADYGGIRISAVELANKGIEERIRIGLAIAGSRFGARGINTAYMNNEDYEVLITSLSSRVIREVSETDAKFGYSSVSVETSAGKVKIYPDRRCPKGTFFAFNMDNLWLFSLGEFVSMQNGDGLQMLRQTSTTDYEARWISYPGFACNKPRNLVRIPLY